MFGTTTSTSNTFTKRMTIHWLDLRGSGLSIYERLLLEEALLRHDDYDPTAGSSQQQQQQRSWLIVGHHEGIPMKYFKPQQAHTENKNPSTSIVLGIGGKPQELLNMQQLQNEPCLTLKRFSGGGTVVLDYNSIWTTLIVRKDGDETTIPTPPLYPQPIMQWTVDYLYARVFELLGKKQQELVETASDRGKPTMILNTKSCSFDNSGKTISLSPSLPNQTSTMSQQNKFLPPVFELKENDYVLGGNLKMGGNAQSIVKDGFLHHTSFLWDFEEDNMNYLQMPRKRPEYRQDRSHSDFLVKLCQAYPNLSKTDFYQALLEAANENFNVQRVNLKEAVAIINNLGGWEAWIRKSRNKILSMDDMSKHLSTSKVRKS